LRLLRHRAQSPHSDSLKKQESTAHAAPFRPPSGAPLPFSLSFDLAGFDAMEKLEVSSRSIPGNWLHGSAD